MKLSTTGLGLIMMESSDYLRKEDTISGGSSPASWTEVNGIPDNICDAFVNYDNGGGFCGPNSICTKKSGSSHASCSCPVGFSALDQSDYWTGCKPNFTLTATMDGKQIKILIL